MNRLSLAVCVVASALALAGCANSVSDGSGPSTGPTDPTSGNNNPAGGGTAPRSDGRALFAPAGGILPYPTDLFFSVPAGTPSDGTLNIPTNNPFLPNAVAINDLDGYSTIAPITVRFSQGIDPASLTAASVRVVGVTIDNTSKATTGVTGPLTLGTDYTLSVANDAGSAGSILTIRPLRPFLPSSGATNRGVLVLITNGVRTTSGAAMNADTDYETARNAAIAELSASSPTCPTVTNATLNGVCRLTWAHLRIGSVLPGPLAVAPNNVILSFSFSTQNTRDTLNALAQIIANPARPAAPIVARPTGLTTSAVIPGLPGFANVFAGTIRVPYYLSRTAPLTASWRAAGPPALPTLDQSSRNLTRFNPVPASTETLTIPLIAAVPNSTSAAGAARPASGWPVVIFQHGFTNDRTFSLLVADAYANAGFVVVGIDLPLHGITNAMNPLYATAANPLYGGTLPTGAVSFERTFDLDAINNTTNAPGPDGLIDPSGLNFLNLRSLLTSRDNLRQSVADLLELTKALPTLDLTGDGTPDIDPARIHFLGHSGGGIVGTTYGSLPGAASTISAAMPGGGIAELLRESVSFSPLVVNGLAASGVTPGTTLFENFFRDAQTAVDSADPVNFIAATIAARPYNGIQVVGGGAVLPDQTVPNSSTQRLFNAAGPTLIRVGSTTTNAAGVRGFVNYTQGAHSSIVSPLANAAAFAAMQAQVVTFAATAGQTIAVPNPAVVQP